MPKNFLLLAIMPLLTFPEPKKDPRFFQPNQFGIDERIYQAIVQTAQQQVPSAAQLTDGASIDTDASLGENFYVTLAGNRTMAAPTNAISWKRIRYIITQDEIGSRTLAWNAAFSFSTTFPSPTLTATANFIDIIEFLYNPNVSSWECLSINKGFG